MRQPRDRRGIGRCESSKCDFFSYICAIVVKIQVSADIAPPSAIAESFFFY